MSEDKDMTPERIWRTTNGYIYKGPTPEPCVEYIRADLVATKVREAREEAFKDAADYIRRQWLAAYPVEVFPEPPPPPAECSRDVISAAMGRHIATRLIEYFERAAESGEGENDG